MLDLLSAARQVVLEQKKQSIDTELRTRLQNKAGFRVSVVAYLPAHGQARRNWLAEDKCCESGGAF